MSDSSPVPATERLTELERRLGEEPPLRILEAVLTEVFPRRIAVVSSFGTDAAVLLHLVASVDRNTPVLFVDTGRHFPETLQYRDQLVTHLGLRDVRSLGPSAAEIARLDGEARLAFQDPDACCALRKVGPLELALRPFDAWVTGRKRHQAPLRRAMPTFETDGDHVKANPLANWVDSDIAAYVAAHELPSHPLAARGYRSIGCAPCTSIVEPGEDPRAGRWRGSDKTECGIHRYSAGF